MIFITEGIRKGQKALFQDNFFSWEVFKRIWDGDFGKKDDFLERFK